MIDFRRINVVFRMVFVILVFSSITVAQDQNNNAKQDWEGGFPDGCTTITIGKKAMADGSVVTSHTCDSHRTRGWLDIMPAQKHEKGAKVTMVKRGNDDTKAMPAYGYTPTGDIPQVENTYGFINTAYPCMNEHQLAIGESTFGGRESCHSEKGLIDC